jgi:Fibronectin type III domain
MFFRKRAFAAVLLVLGAVVVVSTASASRGGGGGGGAPTTPTNLRITSANEYTVSLAWDASRGSGTWWYCVQRPPAGCIRVDPPQTTITLTRLMPDTTFTWVIYAINSRGQRSGNSNSVTYTTPPDTAAPAPPPQLSLTYLRPTRIGVSWTASTDNTSQVWYTLYHNGEPHIWDVIGLRSYTLFNLEQGTTHEFKVVARDRYFNLAESNVISVTTPTSTDTTPPTAPTNLTGQLIENEAWINWTQSTDDTDPPSDILYDTYVDGQRTSDGILGGTSTVAYCQTFGLSTFTVRAVDSSGNVSEPSNGLTFNCPF